MRIVATIISTSEPTWLWQALTSERSVHGLLWIVVLGLLVVMAVGSLTRLAPHRRRLKHLWVNDDGTAMMEFALVLPFLLFMMLLLAQVTLISAGNVQVHYAGYAATRTAITQIPRDHSASGGSAGNLITAGEGDTKYDMIHRAGALACVPISGRATSGSVNADAYLQGLRAYFASLNRSAEPWVAEPLKDRVRYAFNHTSITLASTTINGDGSVSATLLGSGETYRFAPREPVTVRLLHELDLSVPYVRAFFADGSHETGRFANVMAQYTLINEGDPTELPEEPSLQRLP